MSAWFIIRAEVVDATVTADFESWYQNEHLADALEAFNARRAWRGWSDIDPNVHYAMYEFDDLDAARAIPGSDALKRLAAEFDRRWGNKVRRTRDYVDAIQSIGG